MVWAWPHIVVYCAILCPRSRDFATKICYEICMKNPIFVALDVDDDKTAKKIAAETAPYVGGFKIGPRLILRHGDRLIQELSRLAPVFVDCKFHDIPSTVVSALEAAYSAGATLATVHASNGLECLREVARLEKHLARERAFRVLAVTVLTSFNEKNLPPNWIDATPEEHVLKLASLAIQAGLTGIVCSPLEVQNLRANFPEAFLVTPGIRLLNDGGPSHDDQARTMSPQEALAAGANALVIGRPIVSASDPRKAAEAIAGSLG